MTSQRTVDPALQPAATYLSPGYPTEGGTATSAVVCPVGAVPAMPIPDFQTLMLPVLEVHADGKDWVRAPVTRRMCDCWLAR